MPEYQIFNIRFETQEVLSEPEKLGLDALIMRYPHDVDFQNALFSVIFVLYPEAARESMQMSDEEFLEYAKITFFANGGQSDETQTRMIIGKPVETQILKKVIPQPDILETGIVSLTNGESLVFGFKRSEAFYPDTTEEMISKILTSITEI